MLLTGQTAPSFSLPDADMQTVSLSSYKGRKNVVLYFYPRDDTPGCTLEAIEFSDHEAQFGRHDCVILGVSRDDCMVHAEFSDKHGLSVNLLSDFDGEVCRKYGVLREKQAEGVKRLFLVRSTFVIDKKGVIRLAAYGVNPRGHALEVFEAVRHLKP